MSALQNAISRNLGDDFQIAMLAFQFVGAAFFLLLLLGSYKRL